VAWAAVGKKYFKRHLIGSKTLRMIVMWVIDFQPIVITSSGIALPLANMASLHHKHQIGLNVPEL